jgi:UDP:flavonoid glycosyltransferase YjiC (YdhE family)
MKVLAYTSPARGHLYPLVPILDELTARGHQVAVRTLASEVQLMSDRGFDAAPLAPAIEAIEHDDYRARTPPAKLKRGMATFGERSAHEVGDLRAAIDAEQPDAILVDCMTWGATAVAESWGGPWAQWVPFPLLLGTADRSSDMAQSAREAARSRDDLIGVSGRWASRPDCARCARR